MQILFIGDSHANALMRAVKRGQYQDVIAVDVRIKPGSGTKSKEIDPLLPSLYRADAVFCCLGGTEYNLLGLIDSDRKFDFFETPDDVVDETRSLIPHSLVRKALADKMRTTLARMEQARALFAKPFTYVAPPPPFAELAPDAVLPTAFQPLLENGIAPARLRLKLYRLQNAIAREFCEQREIGYLPAPLAAQDANGFLLDAYWDRDPTHGNGQYGSLVIDELRIAVNA